MTAELQDATRYSPAVYHQPANAPSTAFQQHPAAYVIQGAQPATDSYQQTRALRPNGKGYWGRNTPAALNCRCCASTNCCRCCGCVRPVSTSAYVDRNQQPHQHEQPCCLFHQVQTAPCNKKPTRLREPGRRPYSSQPPSPCVFLPVYRRRLYHHLPKNYPQRRALFGIPFCSGKNSPPKMKYVFAVNGKTELRSLNPRDGQFLNRPVTVSFTSTSSSTSPRYTRSTSRTSITSSESSSTSCSEETLAIGSDESDAPHHPNCITSSTLADTTGTFSNPRHNTSKPHQLRAQEPPRYNPREGAMCPPFVPAQNIATRPAEEPHYAWGTAPHKTDIRFNPAYDATWSVYQDPNPRYGCDVRPPVDGAPGVDKVREQMTPVLNPQQAVWTKDGPGDAGALPFHTPLADKEEIFLRSPEVAQPSTSGEAKRQNGDPQDRATRETEHQPQSLSEMFQKFSQQRRLAPQSTRPSSPDFHKKLSSKNSSSIALSSLDTSFSRNDASFEKGSGRKFSPPAATQHHNRIGDDVRAHRRKLDTTQGTRSPLSRSRASVRADARTLQSVIDGRYDALSTPRVAHVSAAPSSEPGIPQKESALQETKLLDPLIAAVNKNTSALARFFEVQQEAQHHKSDARGPEESEVTKPARPPPQLDREASPTAEPNRHTWLYGAPAQQWPPQPPTRWPPIGQFRPPPSSAHPQRPQPLPPGSHWCYPSPAHASQAECAYPPHYANPIPPDVPGYARPRPVPLATPPFLPGSDVLGSRAVGKQRAHVPEFSENRAPPPCYRGVKVPRSPSVQGKKQVHDTKEPKLHRRGQRLPPQPYQEAVRREVRGPTALCSVPGKPQPGFSSAVCVEEDLPHDARELIDALKGRYRYDSRNFGPTAPGKCTGVAVRSGCRRKRVDRDVPESGGRRHRERASWKEGRRQHRGRRGSHDDREGSRVHVRQGSSPRGCLLVSDCCRASGGRVRGRSNRA